MAQHQELRKPAAGEPPLLGFRLGNGKEFAIAPVLLSMECTASQKQVEEQIQATIDRGYVYFTEIIDKFRGSVSLCGSGPSLAKKLHELTGDICAINGAGKFLIERGIIPKFHMVWDADELIEKFMVPHPDVIYLVASRCHPAVFEKLKDCKVYVWHPHGDHDIVNFMNSRNLNEPLLNGGTTGITRGIYLTYALGYRDIHLFGADSCYGDENDTHLPGASVVNEQEMYLVLCGRMYRSTPQWADQLEQMRIIYPMFKWTQLACNLTAHDDGMMSWLFELMERDPEQTKRDAEAFSARQMNPPTDMVPVVLEEGTIKRMAEEGHPEAQRAMKTLQPLGDNHGNSPT